MDAVMVAHNADFDMSFIKYNCSALGLDCEKTVLDTVALIQCPASIIESIQTGYGSESTEHITGTPPSCGR